jgi:hypothetical protein
MENGSSGNGNAVEEENFLPFGKCFLPVISM